MNNPRRINSATSTSARSQKAVTSASKAPAAPTTAAGRDWSGLSRSFWLAVLPPLCGLGLLVGLWAVVSTTTGGSIPSPKDTWLQALEVFSNPFYRNGPNDQGVGWNVLMSLQRVAIGFSVITWKPASEHWMLCAGCRPDGVVRTMMSALVSANMAFRLL